MTATAKMMVARSKSLPEPLTSVSDWETFKLELNRHFKIWKEHDDAVKLMTLLNQGGKELRKIWNNIKPSLGDVACRAESDNVYNEAITLLDAYFSTERNHQFQRPKFRAREAIYYDDFKKGISVTELRAGRVQQYRADTEIVDQYIKNCSQSKLGLVQKFSGYLDEQELEETPRTPGYALFKYRKSLGSFVVKTKSISAFSRARQEC